MTSLSRDVLKWLQSLDLDSQIKNPKWDLSNGYVIAEILSRYFPQQILIHSFYNGCSFATKKQNWFILKNFFLKTDIDLEMEIINGTIHCKEGAAVRLLETLYENLTNKKLKRTLPDFDVITPYYLHQKCLPAYQRTTASRAVKNNLRLTEILADEGLFDSAQGAQTVINEHLEHRRLERLSNPKRFGIKPTLGDYCVRSSGPARKLRYVPSNYSGASEKMPELYWREIWAKCPFVFRDE
ncbi:unnamed protein product [Candidula unifasciata]|uniref:CH-like domain-containing protein n=1 Tax=Candidula unifasciata TaxID=100452 RepID=A0A8S3ZZG4_9EUPU|nr:unnamed protein product [Candidula unifasciata]